MVLKLSDRQNKLLEFIKAKHSEQVRKYTGEAYWKHPLAVAQIVYQFAPEGVEGALCHDLFEDTDCTIMELQAKLLFIGYSDEEAAEIVFQTLDLTNDFTSKNFPNLNRAIRKQAECERLSAISDIAQTIKYADITHNGMSVGECDKSFAKLYLNEGLTILEVMTNGNKELHNHCKNVLQKSLKRLEDAEAVL